MRNTTLPGHNLPSQQKNVKAASVRTLYDLRKTIRARKDREIDSVAEEWEAISSHNTIVNNFSVTQVPSKKVWILQQNLRNLSSAFLS